MTLRPQAKSRAIKRNSGAVAPRRQQNYRSVATQRAKCPTSRRTAKTASNPSYRHTRCKQMCTYNRRFMKTLVFDRFDAQPQQSHRLRALTGGASSSDEEDDDEETVDASSSLSATGTPAGPNAAKQSLQRLSISVSSGITSPKVSNCR